MTDSKKILVVVAVLIVFFLVIGSTIFLVFRAKKIEKVEQEKLTQIENIGFIKDNPRMLVYKKGDGSCFYKLKREDAVLSQELSSDLCDINDIYFIDNFLLTKNSVYIFEKGPFFSSGEVITKKTEADRISFEKIGENYYKDNKSLFYAKSDEFGGYISPMIFESIGIIYPDKIKPASKTIRLLLEPNKYTECSSISGFEDGKYFYYYRHNMGQRYYGFKKMYLSYFDNKITCHTETEYPQEFIN